MAKKTTKKTAAKTTKKSGKKTSASSKSKTDAKTKKAAVKSTKKTTAAKKSAAKNLKEKKQTLSAVRQAKKNVNTKTEKKKTMGRKKKEIVEPKKKKVQKEKKTAAKSKAGEHDTAISAAEIRAKALEKIKGYSKEDLEHFKKIILEKRDEIIEQLQNLRDQMLDPTTGEYINENSPYSLHMAEQGTDAMEREKTFLYAQRENKFLGYLEDALKRIEMGTYGICIECIEEPQHLCETCPLIPKARLEAVPHSQLCLPIKQRQEKR